MDPDLVVDRCIKEQLVEGGMDDLLATHFAHLFIRDPIVIFREDLDELDMSKTDHFENLQSTNWQHIRFKPPPADNSIGWRVEFRPMEIQVTDHENAAFAVFMVLVTRAILSFDLNFYIPIRRVDENMQTAHAVDAVLKQKFWFRKDPFAAAAHPRSSARTPSGSGATSPAGQGAASPAIRPLTPPLPPVEDEYRLMSIDEIINGTAKCADDGDDGDVKDHEFPGLIPLVESYLDSVNVDVLTRCELATYLDLIRRRASGQLCTAARWIRDFVAAHPDYKGDSVVSDEVARDMVGAVIDIGNMEQQKDNLRGLDVFGLEGFLGDFARRCREGD
jgi:glutamate--cysteine ligase catalytic subunit